MSAGGAEKSQQCHMYFLQHSKFPSERPQARTWGRQTCFLSRSPSDLVTKGVHKGGWGQPPLSLIFYKNVITSGNNVLLSAQKGNLPAQKRLIVFANFLLINLSTNTTE